MATNAEETTVGNYFVANYPPFSFWRPEQVPLAGQVLDREAAPETPLGLYVHIPLCRKRCDFCYFRVYTDKDAAAVRRGFDVARVHCLKCHSVNLAGGDLGPELNVPMSVTEYWRPEALPAFIADPLSFRAGARMPVFAGTLDGDEIADVLAYLAFMTGHKVCGEEKACE